MHLYMNLYFFSFLGSLGTPSRFKGKVNFTTMHYSLWEFHFFYFKRIGLLISQDIVTRKLYGLILTSAVSQGNRAAGQASFFFIFHNLCHSILLIISHASTLQLFTITLYKLILLRNVAPDGIICWNSSTSYLHLLTIRLRFKLISVTSILVLSHMKSLRLSFDPRSHYIMKRILFPSLFVHLFCRGQSEYLSILKCQS